MERCRETDGAGEECWCERGVSGVSGGGPAWDAGVDGVAGVVVVVDVVVVSAAARPHCTSSVVRCRRMRLPAR